MYLMSVMIFTILDILNSWIPNLDNLLWKSWLSPYLFFYLQKISSLKCLFIIFIVLQALGEQLKVRQQVIATATVFFKRFYAR